MNITGLREKLDLTGDPTQDVSPSAHMLLALARVWPGHIYAGTANPGKVARRRSKNKQARASRRINRGKR